MRGSLHRRGTRGWRQGLVLLALGAGVLAGCGSDGGIETREVERGDLDAWPFVADRGVLACELGDVPTFTVNGRTIGLDNPDLTGPLWAEDATAADAARVRDAALALCD